MRTAHTLRGAMPQWLNLLAAEDPGTNKQSATRGAQTVENLDLKRVRMMI